MADGSTQDVMLTPLTHAQSNPLNAEEKVITPQSQEQRKLVTPVPITNGKEAILHKDESQNKVVQL